MDGMVPNAATMMRNKGRRRRGRRTRRPAPPREAAGDSGADVVARVDGRRDDRAATIDVVVVVVISMGRDGAERGNNDARQRTTAEDDQFLCPFRRSAHDGSLLCRHVTLVVSRSAGRGVRRCRGAFTFHVLTTLAVTNMDRAPTPPVTQRPKVEAAGSERLISLSPISLPVYKTHVASAVISMSRVGVQMKNDTDSYVRNQNGRAIT
jgi:hypothetical protein